MKPTFRSLAAGIAVAACAAILSPIVFSSQPWPRVARDFLDAEGYLQTGAENLVSALYLGYRAYDTIGETIVLLAALTGAIALISAAAPAAPTPASVPGKGRTVRTEIIDTVTGKLAPIVLLFGCYVMINGHLSPGGGFQGGVVLASGVAFIAIGRREGGLGGIDPRRRAFGPGVLVAVEAFALIALLALAWAGIFGGGGFTGNPLPAGGPLPQVYFIVAMNIAIGLKVGAGIAVLCALLLRTAGG